MVIRHPKLNSTCPQIAFFRGSKIYSQFTTVQASLKGASKNWLQIHRTMVIVQPKLVATLPLIAFFGGAPKITHNSLEPRTSFLEGSLKKWPSNSQNNGDRAAPKLGASLPPKAFFRGSKNSLEPRAFLKEASKMASNSQNNVVIGQPPNEVLPSLR